MKKLLAISFHFHWITLCCFLLPFFYDTCSKKPVENTYAETSTIIPKANDTVSNQSISHNPPKTILADSTTPKLINKKDDVLSERIIKAYPIFENILIPVDGTYTGLSSVINTIPFIPLFATTLTILLLLIGLLAKLIDKNAQKTLLILEIGAGAFLIIAKPIIFGMNRLWGYWICLICISILLLIDSYILFKQKRKEI